MVALSGCVSSGFMQKEGVLQRSAKGLFLARLRDSPPGMDGVDSRNLGKSLLADICIQKVTETCKFNGDSILPTYENGAAAHILTVAHAREAGARFRRKKVVL